MQKVSFWEIWDHIQKVRESEWSAKAIELANKYIAKNPLDLQAYLQLIDIYYIDWDLEKAEKPIDFILSKDIEHWYIDKSVLYYIKALLLSERTEWVEAKHYIKKALSNWEKNPEFQRVLATIEFWSWNKEKWYSLIKEILESYIIDADIILDAVTMATSLWYLDEAKEFVELYFKNREKISFFTKPKEFYDKKFANFKKAFLPTDIDEW